MKYTVTFEVEEGNCELYKQVNPNDCEVVCKTCPLRFANYCMNLNMHKAEVVNVELK